MNVPTIEMDKTEARTKLRAYRSALTKQANREYADAARGYAELARGTKLLMMSQVFTDVPLDDHGRPKLALIRADVRQCRVSANWENVFRFEPTEWRGVHHAAFQARSARINSPRASQKMPEGYALVPMVPPDVLGERALDQHWILWEVEQWAPRIIGARADRDPFLLKRISADLYAVVGEWDLTDLERAVMQRRALA